MRLRRTHTHEESREAMPPTGAPLLEIRDLRTGYGTLPVLHGVDIAIHHAESAAVLGLNGAGKTTLMLAIAGILRPWGGEILLEGEAVGSLPTPERVRRGLALVPEGRRVFPALTVERNLELGAWARRDGDTIAEGLEQVFGLFPRLDERRHQPAGTLSGGEQQMLALGRGLMSRPRLLLVDEASLGLAPILVRELFQLLGRIAEQGVAVLLVEQNVGILKVVDRAFIMEKGSIVYEGAAGELLKSDQIRRAYLG